MISPTLTKYFWDLDPATLDERKHERLVISRVLNYGRMADWRWLARTYGKHHVSAILHSGVRLGLREPARRLANLLFS
jgi:hypothetical protein